MAWPKGKPRNPRKAQDVNAATTPQEALDPVAAPKPMNPAGPVSLVDANRYAQKVASDLRAKRDGVVSQCLSAIEAEYGRDKAMTVAPMLRDLLDGKPIAGRKPKPLRGPING